MATYNVTGVGGTTGHPSNTRTPYLVENTIDVSAVNGDSGTANGDILYAIDIPAETLIMEAGIEVITALSSSATMDLGITGGDVDNFVDGFDADGADALAYAPTSAAYAPVLVPAADTLDILVAAQTGTTLTGTIRVFATLMDISDAGDMAANEVDRDTLA